MGVINNKNSICVQVKDIKTKKSKSFTVKDYDIDLLFNKILFYTEQVLSYDKVRLLCYKKGEKNGKN